MFLFLCQEDFQKWGSRDEKEKEVSAAPKGGAEKQRHMGRRTSGVCERERELEDQFFFVRKKERIINPRRGEKKDHTKKREVQKHESPKRRKFKI